MLLLLLLLPFDLEHGRREPLTTFLADATEEEV